MIGFPDSRAVPSAKRPNQPVVCGVAEVFPTGRLARIVPPSFRPVASQILLNELFFLPFVSRFASPMTDERHAEQRPRAQSRGTATLLPHGHGYLFTTRDRPVRSARGWSAAPVRHGVSAIRSGQRHTLGLVFHDAA